MNYLLIGVLIAAGTFVAGLMQYFRIIRLGPIGLAISCAVTSILLTGAFAATTIWYRQILGMSKLVPGMMTREQIVDVYAMPVLLVWVGMMLGGWLLARMWRRRQQRRPQLVGFWIVLGPRSEDIEQVRRMLDRKF